MAREDVALPVDLLHLLCTELSNSADFDTLYNCLISSKHFANAGAINALYRISHECPIKGGGSDDASLFIQGQVVQKWSILWRTIIMSALGQTTYPYCRHLRMLDLRDLGYLLDDDKFKQGKICAHFFSGPMARFNIVLNTGPKLRGKKVVRRLNLQDITSAIGDVVTEQAPLLESLTEPIIGDIFSSALLTWAPRLSHLRHLDFWDGRPFANETVRNLLYAHCPNINALRMYQFKEDNADQCLAAFISGLPENTLTYFETISDCKIGLETCSALNRHGKSLTTLKLALTEQGVLALAALQGCTSIQTLTLESLRISVDIKNTQNDVYLEITEWLRNCRFLRDASFRNLVSAPDLLTPVLLNKDIQLETLQIDAKESSLYDLSNHHDFHDALGHQQGLRELFLSADAETSSQDDKKALVSGICSLKSLRTLTLVRVSDVFYNTEIQQLAQCLHELESLYIGGFGITDDIWPSFTNLRSLTSLTFAGVTRFSAAGLLRFVDQLSEGNRGMLLSLDFVDPDFALSPEDEVKVAESLSTKMAGEFRYQLLREPNAPYFDSEDSD